jgi:anti-sigma regulatory factor (Ser/Thr protein kinase)
MGQITVPAQTGRLEEVLDFAGNAARDMGLAAKQLNNVNIAVEEVFVNISSYAYPSGEGEVAICVSSEPGRLVIEFRDGGTPYDPLDKTDPDTTLSADEREIGGLGILMVKKLMDDVRYRYEDGKNILTLVKNL